MGKQAKDARLQLNDREYFETRGLNVLVFNNWYDGLFSDAKIAGIELIHHEVRTATNGDIRLSPTPGQWDTLPQFVARRVDTARGCIETVLRYPEHRFEYSLSVEAQADGIRLRVRLEHPLPAALEGRAGFNLEFLPSAYWGKGYLVDGRNGTFPRYPAGPMARTGTDGVQPAPIVKGSRIILAPEDPQRRVSIQSTGGELMLFDGRNTAQNGWFVVRSLLPAGKTGTVMEWYLTASTVARWLRTPVIGHSQVGYHPAQRKVAMIELDCDDRLRPDARLLRVGDDGELVEQFTAPTTLWGQYLRYSYAQFDFSSVHNPGLYILEYGDVRTAAFRIAPDIYADAWHPTLDVFFPVQMDHMHVREAHRVWHGAAHLDDALQAPVDHELFDLYAQGPTTDTPFEQGEHIPGLNIGGWFDAGDFDIRTQTQYITVIDLVHAWETWRIERDETLVDHGRRYVELHVPDGVPDLLQQIEHGTLALIAQHRAVGHAIPGIVEPTLAQYVHLGDAASKTDNRVYSSSLADGKSDGFHSGTPDDRWAFTSKSTPLNYGSIAALAAASRALRGYREELADECLGTAIRVWDEEHQHPPDLFHHGNTTGGKLEEEELTAAVELLITTGEQHYAAHIRELWPYADANFARNADVVARALHLMDRAFVDEFRTRVQRYAEEIAVYARSNPFGVPITERGWAGNGDVIRHAITNYRLHKAFPDVIDAEAVFRGLHYLFGCHPGSDVSFVSAVGAVSKTVAYGSNRADFSFIAGGIVPGVLVLKPDFPENKEDWPFFWGQNEYVINLGASYLFLVNAAHELLNGAA